MNIFIYVLYEYMYIYIYMSCMNIYIYIYVICRYTYLLTHSILYTLAKIVLKFEHYISSNSNCIMNMYYAFLYIFVTSARCAEHRCCSKCFLSNQCQDERTSGNIQNVKATCRAVAASASASLAASAKGPQSGPPDQSQDAQRDAKKPEEPKSKDAKPVPQIDRARLRLLKKELSKTSRPQGQAYQQRVKDREPDYELGILLGLRHSAQDHDESSRIDAIIAKRDLAHRLHWATVRG